ncbi:MAG TPA: FHA domain-containing serine/threonine-protein kinase [Thermoanaerobaculia bacterium]
MIGNVIGNYRIEREIGEGGMSHVYVGRTLAATSLLPAGFAVVLKVMSEELAGDQTARKRFEREAKMLKVLRHRNITRFFEFINGNTGAVLVMEFVDGIPVDLLINEKGALPIGEAVGICQNMLDALIYAHDKDIVHRDIKPANLIREKKTGVVKMTDFGIAKMKEGGNTTGQTVLTKSGFLLGTPHYMSPEQIREPKDAGPKSDVYSAGVVLYEMLTGVLPFNSRSLPKLIDAIYRGEKQTPRALRPEIDAELEAIVLKSMMPRMDDRYRSASEFNTALEEYSAQRPVGWGTFTTTDDDDTTPPPPRVDPSKQWALVHVKPEANEKHAIIGDSVMVGRDRACTIVLSHPAVSRRHARITLTGSVPVLEDLKSANGTYVNNARVERVTLKAGDIVRFGADPACSYVLREHV